ncbi:MAG: hypothetical protein AABY22_13830, partial [Nanoarchaeota archaeon]
FKESTMKKEPKKNIVSVISYGGVLRLNEVYKKGNLNVKGLKEFYSGNRNQDVIFAVNLIHNYFEIIEEILHSQRVNKNKISPREIGALLRLIRHFMISSEQKLKLFIKKDIKSSNDPLDKSAVDYFRKILGYIPFKKVLELKYGASKWAAIEGFILKK